jgi:hypothetical protein
MATVLAWINMLRSGPLTSLTPLEECVSTVVAQGNGDADNGL